MAIRNPAEAKVRALLAAYRMAQHAISMQIAAAIRNGNMHLAAERARQFAVVAEMLRHLGTETDGLVRQLVEEAYRQSARDAARQLAAVGISEPLGGAVGVVGFSFTSIQREAVDQLASALVDRLSTARSVIGRQVQDVFADVGRRQVLQGLLGASGSRQAVSREIVADLRHRGVTGFVDKAGRRWRLENYAEMVARTTTREAVTQGAVARFAAQGINVIQIDTHAGSCPVCVPYQGQYMRLDGSTNSISGLSISPLRLPPFHPRCKHIVLPVIPALAGVA